jgi:peroxiredoxin
VHGDSTKQLILYYTNYLSKSVSDTVSIINGTFKITGNLKNPQKVALAGNIKERAYDNPNIARFYIGADNVTLFLTEDRFNKAKINGSALQDEYIAQLMQTESIYERIYPLMEAKKILIDKINQGDTKDENTSKLNNLNEKHKILLNSIRDKELEYAWNHPNSYLALDIIRFYMKQLSKDSLGKYYSNISSTLKASFQAEFIKEELNFNNNIAKVGQQAPNFFAKNNKGKEISLEQFKGKYVLLDFWAGWCTPCIKNHPELKKIHKTYHDKGLEVIGISLDKDKKTWQAKIEEEKINWHHVYVGLDNFKNENSINKKYNVQPIPAYILIDKEGMIIGRYLNADEENKGLEKLEKKLIKLLN